jgi:hypothetical protein
MNTPQLFASRYILIFALRLVPENEIESSLTIPDECARPDLRNKTSSKYTTSNKERPVLKASCIVRRDDLRLCNV